MTVDGLGSVQARIAAIEQRFILPVAQTASSSASSAAAAPFEAALQTQLGGTPATKRAPGAYGSVTVPPELRAHGNGQIPESAMAEIGVGNHRLSADAAAAFRSMQADAARDGVQIGITDSYRSLDAQHDVAERKGLYSQGGLAATPGTSNHGWGLSVDVDVDTRGQEWLRANGAKYGFVEDVPREPWHWTYRPDPG